MISITTQKQLDELKEIKENESFFIDAELRLNNILTVKGSLTINKKVDCDYINDRYFRASGSATVEAWDSTTVEAWGSATVKARGSATVKARGSATVEAWDSATVEAWDSTTVEAWDSTTVEARGSATVKASGSATVKARGSATVEAWGSATVEAWGSATVEAWDSATVRLLSSIKSLILSGYCVLIKDISIKMNFKKSKNALVQNIKPMSFFERDNIEFKNGKTILYKRVSNEFKTQEKTDNETSWIIGTIVEHKNYRPDIQECGEGKFHACSRPFFCDEFRSNKGDKYIAIEILKKDLFEWTKSTPSYPHKIAFRKGKVLYECDSFGREVKV